LIETSPDNANWTTEVASATLLTLTGGAGGSTEVGIAKVGCRLDKKDVRYVRVKATPNLNATDTDTARSAAVSRCLEVFRIRRNSLPARAVRAWWLVQRRASHHIFPCLNMEGS